MNWTDTESERLFRSDREQKEKEVEVVEEINCNKWGRVCPGLDRLSAQIVPDDRFYRTEVDTLHNNIIMYLHESKNGQGIIVSADHLR